MEHTQLITADNCGGGMPRSYHAGFTENTKLFSEIKTFKSVPGAKLHVERNIQQHIHIMLNNHSGCYWKPASMLRFKIQTQRYDEGDAKLQPQYLSSLFSSVT